MLKQDLYFSNLSDKVFNIVNNYLSENGIEGLPQTSGGVYFPLGQLLKHYELPEAPSFNDVFIVLLNSHPDKLGSMVPQHNGSYNFTLYIADDINKLSSVKDVFVHEMQHYYDLKRRTAPVSSKRVEHLEHLIKCRAEWGVDEYIDYFNNPEEFNPYTQEAINAMVTYWKKKNIIPKFDAFLEESIKKNLIFNDFWIFLSIKYRKKFIKRIYRLWAEIK